MPGLSKTHTGEGALIRNGGGIILTFGPDEASITSPAVYGNITAIAPGFVANSFVGTLPSQLAYSIDTSESLLVDESMDSFASLIITRNDEVTVQGRIEGTLHRFVGEDDGEGPYAFTLEFVAPAMNKPEDPSLCKTITVKYRCPCVGDNACGAGKTYDATREAKSCKTAPSCTKVCGEDVAGSQCTSPCRIKHCRKICPKN